MTGCHVNCDAKPRRDLCGTVEGRNSPALKAETEDAEDKVEVAPRASQRRSFMFPLAHQSPSDCEPYRDRFGV